jgi:hypothetical protein
MAPFDTLTRTQKCDLIIAQGFTEQTQITMSPAAVDKREEGGVRCAEESGREEEVGGGG